MRHSQIHPDQVRQMLRQVNCHPRISGGGTRAQDFVSRALKSDPLPSSGSRPVEFVSGVSSSVALKRKVQLRSVAYVASSPAYRASPKDMLRSVFEDFQRAARAKKVSRIVERLATLKS